MRSWVLTLTMLAAGAAAPLATAAQGQAGAPAPDNTKINQRDRSSSEPTADKAKNNSSDVDTMRRIRRAIVADKSLSTYAHNVKIIAENGKVTLKGPVRSEEEKQNIESKAVEIVGAGNVVNELDVKPGKADRKKPDNAS